MTQATPSSPDAATCAAGPAAGADRSTRPPRQTACVVHGSPYQKPTKLCRVVAEPEMRAATGFLCGNRGGLVRPGVLTLGLCMYAWGGAVCSMRLGIVVGLPRLGGSGHDGGRGAGRGRAADVKDSAAVKDTYAGLKALLAERFRGKQAAEVAPRECECGRPTWEAPLSTFVGEAGVGERMVDLGGRRLEVTGSPVWAAAHPRGPRHPIWVSAWMRRRHRPGWRIGTAPTRARSPPRGASSSGA
jgi:hypothetical protein